MVVLHKLSASFSQTLCTKFKEVDEQELLQMSQVISPIDLILHSYASLPLLI